MNNNNEYHYSEEEIKNIRELGQVLRDIRALLISEGVDIEKVLKELRRKHKKN